MEKLNRQQTVIAIAKLHRLTKQLLYWTYDDSDLYFPTFEEEVSEVNKWVEGIYWYLKENPCKIIAAEIEKIGSLNDLENYVNRKNGRLDARLHPNIVQYLKKMHKLEALVRTIMAKKDSKYPGLPPALANEQTVALFQRSVDAGLLDEHFMPLETTTGPQLRVIAFAIASIMKFPNRCKYVYFEKFWNRATYRVGGIHFPKRDRKEKHEFAMSLYPEAGFSPILEVCSENDTLQSLWQTT